jgi:3-oxoacyl-[acyl-carrier-protein] synthase I
MVPLHVVAIAARTPVGLNAESSAAAVRAGISRVMAQESMVDLRGEPLRMACDGLLGTKVYGAARMHALAASAIAELTGKLSASRGRLVRRIPWMLALPEPRPHWSGNEVRVLAGALEREPSPAEQGWQVTPMPLGHAAGIEGLRLAAMQIEAGAAELCVVGGVDTLFETDAVTTLDAKGKIAADGVRAGFPPGEAAAFVAVCSDRTRAALGLPSLAVVEGLGTAAEERPGASGALSLGAGLTQAVRTAFDALSSSEVADDVYCDINGERWRTEDWGFAVLRMGRRLRQGGTYRTAATQCGDVGAATAAWLCVLAVRAWQRRYATGPRALVVASSMASLRGAAVLRGQG